MAADDPRESFDVRFRTFHDACSEDEQQFLAWLFSFSPDTLGVGDEPEVDGFGGSLIDTTQQLETQMSFKLQYLQLQSQMQNENRSYTAVSNILETKHDSVKSSISKVR